jgi:biotin carboxylase
MSANRVLVVGTTPDYVHRLEAGHPQRCVFLTDSQLRAFAKHPPPSPEVEVVANLEDPDHALALLADHVARYEQKLHGIVCFDCESMALAAWLGRRLDLEYPSPLSIALARNKHVAVQRWRAVGLPAPRASSVETESHAVRFLRSIGGPVVLKPLSGSGSEFVFLCRDEEECRSAYRSLQLRLATHPDARMYAPLGVPGATVDPRTVFAAQEFIDGVEMSCDFVVAGGAARIIRVCRKIVLPGEPLGRVNAYLMPAALPWKVSLEALESQLFRAASALGLKRAICMADLIVRDRDVVMIELTPRLAGDCLPALIRASTGLDVFGFALDFAVGASRPPSINTSPRQLVALRLVAKGAGMISRLDSATLRADPRVVSLEMFRTVGDFVLVPPDGDDRSLLGYAIFEPNSFDSLSGQCLQVAARLKVAIDPQTSLEHGDAEFGRPTRAVPDTCLR